MNPGFIKALRKWAVACLGFFGCYMLFGDIGIIFGVGLAYVAVKYL